MRFTKQEYKKFNKKKYNSFILGADIGGTNTSLGIFGIKNNMPQLLLSFHFKSQELKGLHSAINETLNYVQKNHKVKITKACIAGAGVVSPKKESMSITKLGWGVNQPDLSKKTKLKKIAFINDFEAVGYGINMIKKNDVKVIKKSKQVSKAPIVVIGAGSGLGKTTLIYKDNYKTYVPLASEGGHCDFAAQSKYELELVDFIKNHKKLNQVSYEQIVSGIGLNNIYLFLRHQRNRQNQRFCGPENSKRIFSESKIFVATKIQRIFAGSKKFNETKYTKEIDKAKNKPELISKYRKIDATCKATFEIFKMVYAKFAKNCALDALPYGGIYIAGGIAPKNRDIFDKSFIKEFENEQERLDVLKKISIYLVLNYNIGLLGTGFFGAKFL